MPTTRERVSMLEVDIIVSKTDGSTALLRATSFEAEETGDEWDSDAGSVAYSQWSAGRRRFNGTLEYEIGGDENPKDIARFGDKLEIVSVQTITEGEDLFWDFMDETQFGAIGVTRNRGRVPGSGHSTGVIEFRSGLLQRVPVP